MFRFLHVADLHLGAPLALRDEPPGWAEYLAELDVRLLDNLVNEAIAEKVSFVLLAGDVFETPRPSIRMQRRFVNSMDELNHAGIYCGIIEGNHDVGVWRHFAFPMPENVHIFQISGGWVEWPVQPIDGRCGPSHTGKVGVWGASFDLYRSRESIVPKFPDQPTHWWNIGMFHAGRNTGQYHPYSLGELSQSPFQYHALGHEHAFDVKTNPPLVYPGVTQGRDRSEPGSKGAVLVEVDWSGLWTAQLRPMAPLEWRDLSVTTNDGDINAVLNRCLQAITKITTDARTIIVLRLQGANDNHGDWMKPSFLEEFHRTLCDEIETSVGDLKDSVAIDRVLYEGLPSVSLEEIREREGFFDQLMTQLEVATTDPEISALLRQWNVDIDTTDAFATASRLALTHFANEEDSTAKNGFRTKNHHYAD